MKTLGLILAAGKGNRIKNFLNKDEPVKAMLRIGNKRLIDLAIESLNGIEKAVLSSSSPEFNSLNEKVSKYGIPLLMQKAKHRNLPTLLELPHILLTQYYLSQDREYLQSFDAIMTVSCDLALNGVDLKDMLEFHYEHSRTQNQRQVTFLCKRNSGKEVSRLVKTRKHRVLDIKKGKSFHGYESLSLGGIYVISQGLLRNPLMALLGYRHNLVYRYLTKRDWIDYGNPISIEKLRNKSQA
jgi:NDP-sugar pyrophosphorylase family protein